MDMKIGVIITLVIGVVLLGAMLPTALTSFYNVKSDKANHPYGIDAAGAVISTDLNITDNSAVSAIFRLLPLFAVLGGMTFLAGIALKESGII